MSSPVRLPPVIGPCRSRSRVDPLNALAITALLGAVFGAVIVGLVWAIT
jgi:hypothetical protein